MQVNTKEVLQQTLKERSMTKSIEFNVTVAGKAVVQDSVVKAWAEIASVLDEAITELGMDEHSAHMYLSGKLPQYTVVDKGVFASVYRIVKAGVDVEERLLRYHVRTFLRSQYSEVLADVGFTDVTFTASRPNVRLQDDVPPKRRAQAEAVPASEAAALIPQQ